MPFYLKTRKIIVSNVFDAVIPFNAPPDFTKPSFGVLVEIDSEAEAALPDFCDGRVDDYSWPGLSKGTRAFRLRSGQVRPMVFGIPASIARDALGMNASLDSIVRGCSGTIAFTPATRGGKTWPILRAVHVDYAKLPANNFEGFTQHIEDMTPFWERS